MAIKIAYNLPKNTPHTEYLNRIYDMKASSTESISVERTSSPTIETQSS